MAGPSASLTAPPEGWVAHRFWHDLQLELHARQLGITAACVCLALLVLGRALLPVADRSRVRMGVLFVAGYLGLLIVKPALLNLGMDGLYATAQLAALVTLSWAIVGVCGMAVFDLVGRR